MGRHMTELDGKAKGPARKYKPSLGEELGSTSPLMIGTICVLAFIGQERLSANNEKDRFADGAVVGQIMFVGDVTEIDDGVTDKEMALAVSSCNSVAPGPIARVKVVFKNGAVRDCPPLR